MASENEVEGIEYRCFREYFRIGGCQEVVLEAETLYIPACTPDMWTVGNAVRSLLHLLVQLLFISGQSFAESGGESFGFLVLHLCKLFFHTCRVPADAAYLLDDELFVVQNEVHIGLFARGEVQFYGCLHFGEQGSVVAASGRSIYFASNVEAMHTQCIIETFQYT